VIGEAGQGGLAGQSAADHADAFSVKEGDGMKKISAFLTNAVNVIMVIALCVMVVLVFGNVVLRYVFSTGISFSEELSRYLFVWLTFIGAIAALRNSEHLGLDTVVKRVPLIVRKIMLIVSTLIMIYICHLILRGSWNMTTLNMNSKAPTTGLPLSFIYVSGVIAGAAMFVLLVIQLYRILANKLKPDEWVPVKESEEFIDIGETGAKEGKQP
jgi:TRAP-type C4-dicarboxylate transport system permease small subunit